MRVIFFGIINCAENYIFGAHKVVADCVCKVLVADFCKQIVDYRGGVHQKTAVYFVDHTAFFGIDDNLFFGSLKRIGCEISLYGSAEKIIG